MFTFSVEKTLTRPRVAVLEVLRGVSRNLLFSLHSLASRVLFLFSYSGKEVWSKTATCMISRVSYKRKTSVLSAECPRRVALFPAAPESKWAANVNWAVLGRSEMRMRNIPYLARSLALTRRVRVEERGPEQKHTHVFTSRPGLKSLKGEILWAPFLPGESEYYLLFAELITFPCSTRPKWE